MRKKVLVTGGAGFIGSNIAEELAREWDVIVFDDLSTGSEKNLQGIDIELVKGDVRDKAAVESACRGVESIFHLAAQISVPLSMEDPEATVRINTLGTLNVLDAAIRAGVESIVFSSSAAVYGDNPQMPKREDMLPEPKSPYAVSKLDGEYYLKIASETSGLRAVALRYFNVFGPRQSPHSAYAAAVPAFVYRAVKGEDITIFGDGEQTRDFVYVKDVARANLMAAGIGADPGAGVEAGSGVSGSVFNVACGRSISINALAEMIVAITGSSSKIVHAEERPGDIKHSLADVTRIREKLAYQPNTDLEAGLETTVEYFRSLMEFT
jgi:UDP-glucose 4-epimerase